jgi:hypothetical protein
LSDDSQDANFQNLIIQNKKNAAINCGDKYEQHYRVDISIMDMSEDFKNRLRMDEESLGYSGELDLAFLWKLLSILVGPLLSLLMLYLWSPEADVGRLFAFLFWPFFHFIIGMVLSYLEQSRIVVDDDGRILSISDKKKQRVYHIRLIWILLLTLFEFFGAIFVLAADQGIPVQYWLFLGGLYVIYALVTISWLKRVKQLKTAQGNIKK